MSVTQLNPPIPLDTPKGEGYAQFLIDYSPDMHLYWVVFINDTGECWTFSNPDVRATKNITLGRIPPEKGVHYDEQEEGVQRCW